MKWLVLFALLLGMNVYAQDGNPKAAIIAVEQARIAAMLAADTIALDTILAGEYTMTNPDGVTWTKHEYLTDLADGKLKFDSLQPLTDDIIVYDKAATITGRFRGTVTAKGSTKAFEAKHLRVYVCRANRWQLVAQQVTRLSKSE